jgi:hypothetical protein
MTGLAQAVPAPEIAMDNERFLTDSLIERLAQTIVERRLETPALFFFEMNKPLAFLMGQSVLVASPLLAPLFGVDKVQALHALLDDRRNVDRLMDRIEELYLEKQDEGVK